MLNMEKIRNVHQFFIVKILCGKNINISERHKVYAFQII